MVAMPELQSEALKWQRRINMIQGAGLPGGPIQELARTDLMRLAQGGTPFSESQVTTMVYGAYTGKAQVSQAPSLNRPDNNPFHWVGNAIKDIGSDVQQWPMGFFHEAADIINPHKWEEIPADLAKTVEDFPNVSQAAKDFFATPIIGPISPIIASAIPGVGEGVAAGLLAANAYSMGWTGFTQHPLNFMLNVLPLVDVAGKAATAGVSAEEASGVQSSLKEGHPLGALAKATGLEKQFQQMISNGAGGPLAQYMLAPVWRGYNRLKRIHGGAMVKGYIDSLYKRGILKENMSIEDGHTIVEKAITNQKRYEKQAKTVPADLVAAANGNKEAAFGGIPSGTDVAIWTNAKDSVIPGGGSFNEAPQPIYFSKQQAQDAAGDPNIPVSQARVPVESITYDEKSGIWSGADVLPYADDTGQPIYYTPEDIRVFGEIQNDVSKFRNAEEANAAIDENNKSTAESVILADAKGNTATYYKKSLPYEKHQKFAVKSKALDKLNKEHDRAAAAYDAQAQIVARHTSKHYWRFGDTEAETAARAATVPSIKNLEDAALPFIHKGMTDPALSDAIHNAFSRLSDAFESGNMKEIRGRLRTLRTLLRNSDHALKDYADYLHNELKGGGVTEGAAKAAIARSARLKAAKDNASDAVVKAMAEQHDAQQEYYKALEAQPPSEANYLVERQARGRATQKVVLDYIKRSKVLQAKGTVAALQELRTKFQEQLNGIRTASDREELGNAISKEDGAKALASIEKDAIADWTGMVQKGFHPIWFYKIDEKTAREMTFGSVKPMTSGHYTSKAIVDQILDYTPRSLDIGLILPAAAMEYMMSEATRQFANYMINDSGAVSTLEKITADLKKRFPDMGEAAIKKEIESKYDVFNPSEYADGFDPEQQYLMPKAIKEGFARISEGARFPFKKTHQKVTKVFKVSTLSGPRHLVHVGVGGVVMMAIRDPGALMTAITHPMEVWKTMRTGELPGELRDLADPEWVRENILQGNYEQTIGAISGQFRPGKQLGQWFNESLQEGEFNVTDIPKTFEKGLEKLNNIENTTTDMYRTAVFLHDLRHGASRNNVEAAMANVHKILIDVDNMTPFEQTVVKQVFPFWSFTKHIMQYVFTLPADHPIRAAVLANLAQQVAKDSKGWTDPLRLQKLLFFGEPDAKGNVWTADLSNLNPFRSMSSVFTMGGFLSGLAPEFQTGLRIVGINPLSGAPSSFPSYSYNAYTGTRTATRPKLNIFDWVENFVPETQIFDHFLLFTDTMRQLKQTNPEAYSRSFYQELNLPFALAPINIYDIRAKAAEGQFLDAQDAVASAMRTGDVSKIRTFDAVPFNGRLYDANQVANFIEYFDKLYPGLAPKATIKKPKTVRTKQVLSQL